MKFVFSWKKKGRISLWFPDVFVRGFPGDFPYRPSSNQKRQKKPHTSTQKKPPTRGNHRKNRRKNVASLDLRPWGNGMWGRGEPWAGFSWGRFGYLRYMWEWRLPSDLGLRRFFADCTMANHYQTTVWENMFGTFSRHLMQIQDI